MNEKDQDWQAFREWLRTAHDWEVAPNRVLLVYPNAPEGLRVVSLGYLEARDAPGAIGATLDTDDSLQAVMLCEPADVAPAWQVRTVWSRERLGPVGCWSAIAGTVFANFEGPGEDGDS